MSVLRIILTVLFVIDCLGLSIVVLMQEGKQNGLGAIGGGMMTSSDTYWSKNKKRSKEGMIVNITRVLGVLFFVLAAVLNLSMI